ncbi:hypothetical protein C8R43DRAFT_1018038 [Mycena crocata]|nr:hypothetical protein C8R43DRAFT_1018038 [Mycena crocata]
MINDIFGVLWSKSGSYVNIPPGLVAGVHDLFQLLDGFPGWHGHVVALLLRRNSGAGVHLPVHDNPRDAVWGDLVRAQKLRGCAGDCTGALPVVFVGPKTLFEREFEQDIFVHEVTKDAVLSVNEDLAFGNLAFGGRHDRRKATDFEGRMRIRWWAR